MWELCLILQFFLFFFKSKIISNKNLKTKIIEVVNWWSADPIQHTDVCILVENVKSKFEWAANNTWRRKWQPTPLLPGKSHGRRSLVGCSSWGREESATTERLHFHFSLSCIGERNGNPLQCSCLENPRDGEAWWAAIYGVTQSRTQLKRLSSSSS